MSCPDGRSATTDHLPLARSGDTMIALISSTYRHPGVAKAMVLTNERYDWLTFKKDGRE